jgi:hypothetical protein
VAKGLGALDAVQRHRIGRDLGDRLQQFSRDGVAIPFIAIESHPADDRPAMDEDE